MSDDPVTSAFLNGKAKIRFDFSQVKDYPLADIMLRGVWRSYVVKSIKAPLMRLFISLANRLPEPNKRNCGHPNSHILLDIRDEFFAHEDNEGRKAFFEALFKLIIAEYEHDSYYRERMDWCLNQLSQRQWVKSKPRYYWKEEIICQI